MAISHLTVREAGRTSVLSSRWRKRWTFHSNLHFDGSIPELAGFDADRFVEHVNAILDRHSGLELGSFALRAPAPALGEQHAHHLRRWIEFAAASKAKHVVLDLSPPEHELEIAGKPRLALPDNCYHLLLEKIRPSPACPRWRCYPNPGVVSLALGNVALDLVSRTAGQGQQPLSACWFPALKKLELTLVKDVWGGGLAALLSNCPAVEWLNIQRCSTYDLVVPQARCLRYLRIAKCRLPLRSIQIDAPSLTTFDYLGHNLKVAIKANHSAMTQLSQARLVFSRVPFQDGIDYFWKQLSGLLSHVARLVLEFCMNGMATQFVTNPTKFVNLRNLTISYDIYDGNPKSALAILRLTQIIESAPQLEHYFVLHMDRPDKRADFLIKPDDSIRPCAHHSLKTAYMTGVSGLPGQLDLAKYILQSADALEFMTLNLLASYGQYVCRYQVCDPVGHEPMYSTTLEKFSKNYLDPQGAYRHVLKIRL